MMHWSTFFLAVLWVSSTVVVVAYPPSNGRGSFPRENEVVPMVRFSPLPSFPS